eukprot:TRINITY_DN3020_c0_g1_i3.p2 TRINITY_DN3020_c0_g1~~TRINITY_DN3020_c0_g1_i3.p2  ORF type:complete len:595 (+),score=99.53 TRINITY_DN3020_c0_g1_i3:285-2069(+)
MQCLHLAVLRTDAPAAVFANLALAQVRYGLDMHAIEHMKHAIALEPHNAVYAAYLGNMYRDVNLEDQAEVWYQTSISLDADFAGSWINYAGILSKDNEYKAIAAYERVIVLRPELLSSYVQLASLAVRICNWTMYDQYFPFVQQALQEMRGPPRHDISVPLPLNAFETLRLPGLNWRDVLAVAAAHSHRAQLLALRALSARGMTELPKPATLAGVAMRKLRVGYLTGDFGDHLVAKCLVHAWLRHDRERLEIILFALNDDSSSHIHLQTNAVDRVVSLVGLDVIEAAQAIKCDVLIDLMGFTENERSVLLALQPAPVQALFFAYVGTRGAAFVQHVISDRVTAPPDLLRYQMTERVVYLGGTSHINSHKYSFAHVPLVRALPFDRERLGVSADAFVYCSFNNAYKLDRVTFNLWLNILRAVPHSVLWIQRMPATAEPSLRAYAHARGIAHHRIVFTNMSRGMDHMRYKQTCDLFLDSLQYNAHSTAADALWAGIPLLTRPGVLMSQRHAASMLVDLVPELVVTTDHQYQLTAIELATKRRADLTEMRERLARKRLVSSAFDTDRMAAQLDCAYLLMHEAKRAGVEFHQIVIAKG